MANQSSADVTITIHGPVKEFIDYAKKVSKDAYYTLISEESLDEVIIETLEDGRETCTISGWAEGRWAYSNNLEEYFAPLRTGTVWRDTKEAVIAYGKLVSALRRDRSAYVKIDYTDIETGAGFIDIGSLELTGENIDNTPHVDSNSYDSNIGNVMKYLDQSEYEAIDTVWGDEVASGWDEYQDLGGLLSAEEFVDEYSSAIYDGEYIGDILDKEAAEPKYDEYVKKGGKFSLEDFAQEYGKYIRAGDFDLESWLEKERLDRE